jgi:DNA/RNA endonuclease YhcR with UshA esterase domain
MKVTISALLIAVVVLLSNPSVSSAHHSFGGTYDVEKKITLKGKMVQLSFRSPHSFFYIEVQDSKGNVERWAIEGAAAAQFAQQGIDKDVFKIGDPVEVIANPSRSPNSTRARLIKITRTTDGKSWGGVAGQVVD